VCQRCWKIKYPKDSFGKTIKAASHPRDHCSDGINPNLKESIPYPQPHGLFPGTTGSVGRAINIGAVLQKTRQFIQNQLSRGTQVESTEENIAFAKFLTSRVFDSPDGQAMLDLSSFILSAEQKRDSHVLQASNKTCISIAFLHSQSSATPG
jgi:hypothetical protein